MLLSIAARFRDALVPFLIVASGVLLALFAILIMQRLLRAAAARRRVELERRYRPLLDAALASDDGDVTALQQSGRAARRVTADLLLGTLRIVKGQHAVRARALAAKLGLIERWRGDLGARAWWRRAEAALALGLIADRRATRELIQRLDDDEEQVRAAAIDALGLIGDALAITPLLERMNSPTRHERARVIQALRAFGERATEPLLAFAEAHPAHRALVADVLSHVGGAAAASALLEWSRSGDAATRAAAWTALAAIGIDDRAFYHAIKALRDDEAAVRAAAARALAGSGRADGAPYLAARVDDEWEVAAQAARALVRLGEAGRAALQARAAGEPGLGQQLAAQLLWEGRPR